MTGRRFSFAWYFFALFAVALFSISLDAYVNLDACDYDSCRYLRFSTADAGLDGDLIFSGTGTQAMHLLYGDVGFPYKFLYAGLLNFLTLSLFLLIFGIRCDLFFIPLVFSFVVLPGKEFFVIAALLVYFSYRGNHGGGAGLLRLTCALLLLLFARPSFALIFFFAYCLWYLVALRGWWVVFLVCLCLSAMVGVFVGLVSPPDPDHSALQLESSIESISIVRNLTFGFDVQNVWIRSLIYFSYLIFLPFLEMYRLYSDISADVSSPAQFYALGAMFSFLLYFLRLGWGRYWRLCCVSAFVISGTYPFLHTRYLLPVTLMIYFLIIFEDEVVLGGANEDAK